MHRRGLYKDLAILAAYVILALIFFWPVTLGGRSMLPADNVFAWEPWRASAETLGITAPHNGLLTDLYLQNYVWKDFIRESLRSLQVPLWNPYILAGVPFLAAGQHSALYPFSVLFYLLPLWAAYGWFAALHVALAAAFTYAFCRTQRIGRVGALIAGVTFAFGGFMTVSHVFPMIVAAAVWLPLILALIERVARRAEGGAASLTAYLPEVAGGALAFGMVLLAGHPEMYYYVALTSALYALWRMVRVLRRGAELGHGDGRTGMLDRLGPGAGALLAMALLGIGLGAAQWLPLLDLVRHNFREGAATLAEVLGWGFPPRRVIALLIPDFFGNPTHHSYFDLFTWRTTPVTVNALGEPIEAIYWGVKNYVEGGAYVGTLALVLALVGVLGRRCAQARFFGGLGLVSLLFAFGSRLYAVVYALPGLSQVHSPFRWVYIYSLCAAVLAGMGADLLYTTTQAGPERSGGLRGAVDRFACHGLPLLALLGGGSLLGGLGLSLLFRERLAVLSERVIARLALANQAFSDGRMFYSYQFRNLLIFALALAGAGALLLLRRRLRRPGLWGALAALWLFAELAVIAGPFYPAIDRHLVGYRPPVVDFLQGDGDLFRITSLVGGSEKTFNANAGMLYGLQDVRGYDSIIPRQYVEYMSLLSPQTELPYNRIAPLFDWHPEALDSPLLDLLNVRYVLAAPGRELGGDGYRLVYDAEVRVYENLNALPRAFLVPEAVVIQDPEARQEALRHLDPRHLVILEEAPSRAMPVADWASGSVVVPAGPAQSGRAVGGLLAGVEAIHYTPNEVTITLNASAPCYLVLADNYAAGWLAYLRPTDVPDPARAEQELHIYRANGTFRAVEVPDGRHVVRFKYSPNPVKMGLYVSAMAGIVWLLALAVWVWTRFYRTRGTVEGAHLVTKNALAPIGLSLLNKAIDMVFAMLMLRVLGPADAGEYYFAVVVIGWFDIITNFGLNTLITRDLARDRTQANRYLANASILRVGLCLASAPVLGVLFLLRGATTPLDPRTMLAIALFALGLLPSNISAGLSAVFIGYERMEVPAFVTTLTTLLKVVLGTLALLVGTGYIGLAGVSIVVNLATMLVLYSLVRATLFRPRAECDWAFQWSMLRDAYPLMINNLLATLFFKVSVFLLEWQVNDAQVVGWYGTAYKYIDAVGVIPAYFTLAIFPLMSRHAESSKEALLRAYRLAIKLLVLVAIPLAVLGWAFAGELITVLGGSQYLPESASILRVMIWYMPIGFINSVTQYVLIALGQQRYLTRAFAIGLTFAFVANLLGIRLFGYMASAYVAVVAEVVLLVPFYMGVRRYLTPIAWGRLLWRHVAAALPLAGLLALRIGGSRLMALGPGLVAYALGLLLLGALDREERQALGRALPLGRVQGLLSGLRAVWRPRSL